MKKCLIVCLSIVLMGTVSFAAEAPHPKAGAGYSTVSTFDDFETDAGNDGTSGIRGISTANWPTIDDNWERQNFIGSNVARSRLGGEDVVGNIMSAPISMAGANVLSIDHSGFVGGRTVRNFPYYGPLDINKVQVWGSDGAGNLSPAPLYEAIAQSDPRQNTFFEWHDHAASYSHAVVKAVDAYGAPVGESPGFGWLAIDDIETGNVESRVLWPNGGFQGALTPANGWNTSGNAWGNAVTPAGGHQETAPEGGRVAGSQLGDDETTMGELWSTTTVPAGQDTLKFWMYGFDGFDRNAQPNTAALLGTGANWIEIQDGGGSVIWSIPGGGSDNGTDVEIDLASIGLLPGNSMTIRMVDDTPNTGDGQGQPGRFGKSWIATDYLRFTPEPTSMLLLGMGGLLSLRRRKKA